LALRPVSQTLAWTPRGAHAKRKGGKSSRSVSSSARMTLRSGSFAICRRIQRFFLSVRVGLEHVARALPHLVPLVQRASDGAHRDVDPHSHRQKRAEQRRRPAGRRVAEGVRGLLQEPHQQPSHRRRQLRRASVAYAVTESAQPSALVEAAHPIVQGLPRHAEARRNLGLRRATIELQERNDALHDPPIPYALQRRSKPSPLPRRQPKVPHGSPCRGRTPPAPGSSRSRAACQISSVPLLRGRVFEVVLREIIVSSPPEAQRLLDRTRGSRPLPHAP
jgi:hypothetical protein